ncbi:hypothetical protein ACOMHN_001262 [Nucella lapillus]
MASSSEEMDGVEETMSSTTPVSSPEVQNHSVSFSSFCFEPEDEKQYSTKKEKLARRGCETPGITYAPPRPPAKSAPPVSRIFAKRQENGPMGLSFCNPPSLESPHYNKNVKKTYFEQLFTNHTKIGQGSFGEVYRVTFKDDGKQYAIKKAPMSSWSSGRRNRVTEEVRKHEMVPEHPNIIKFILSWVEDSILYIKLELCKESLDQLTLEDHDISEDKIWQIFADLLFGVRHLHSHNMVHMDIKPENILVTFGGVCKLSDLGLVIHNLKPHSHAEEGDGRYLAPEAINGNPGKPSDIFSLGMTILELAADLDVPLIGNLWQNLRKGILPTELLEEKNRSPLLQNVIEWMLLQDYKQRPTVFNLLEHPELYPRFAKREKQYNFREKKIQVKPDMPSLEDLAKQRVKIRPESEDSDTEEPLVGAVGGVAEENMRDLSVSNENRGSDEVDGLIPTCKEVLTRALLPQEPAMFPSRHTQSEPFRRIHSAVLPEFCDSPMRHVKMPRLAVNGGNLVPVGCDDNENAEREQLQKLEDGDRMCAPRNLMRLFNAADKLDDDDDVTIPATKDDETCKKKMAIDDNEGSLSEDDKDASHSQNNGRQEKG